MENSNEKKVCAKCGRELSIDKFRRTKWGTCSSICEECISEKRRENKDARKAAALDELNKARNTRLSDFTPRELMEELRRRGSRGTLEVTVTRTEKVEV